MALKAKAFTGTAAAETQVFTGAIQFGGYSIREAAGSPAAALVEIFDALTAVPPLLATIPLAASGSAIVVLPQNVQAVTGVRTKVTTGTVSGSVYLD